jgi:hypothetical protein
MTEQVSNIYKAWLKESARFPKHEECQPGEIWICNVPEDWGVEWATARMGKVAHPSYKVYATDVSKLRPVFVSEDEVKNAFDVVDFLGRVFSAELNDYGVVPAIFY